MDERPAAMNSRHDITPHGRLRPAALVMSPARAAAAFPSRLSFGRTAVERLLNSECSFERLRIDLDSEGVGSCLYRLVADGQRFHFLVVSENFDPSAKTDHSAGRNWDASAVLCEGDWSPAREQMLLGETPKQRHGRFDYDTLCTLRGNRSARLFSHIVESLAQGCQPSAALISEVGYALRTTGVIANGALGMRPFAGLEAGHPFARPYEVQMVSSLLLREYTFDLLETMARHRNPQAVSLAPALKRFIGVGNAAGAGLVPFIVNNPVIIDRWCRSFEEALALARDRLAAEPLLLRTFVAPLLDKAIAWFNADQRSGNGIYCPSSQTARELAGLRGLIRDAGSVAGLPGALDTALAACNAETAEVFHAIAIELLSGSEAARFTDDLTCLAEPHVRPAQPIADLRRAIETAYDWALEIDFSDPDARHYAWYRSVAAPLDPRRTVRATAPWPEVESRMDIAWKVRQLYDMTAGYAGAMAADLVSDHPQLRDIAARVQSCAELDYAEFRDNLIDRRFRPFAAMRLSLAFYGMEKLDPSLPKSARGAFLQGAPTMAEIAARTHAGDWPFPLAPEDDGEAPVPVGAPVIRRPASEADGTAGAPAPVSTQTEMLLCSPRELHRLLSKALLATGYFLGQSERLASAVLFSETLHGNAIDACISDMRRARPVQATGLRFVGNGCSHDLSGISLAGPALDAADLTMARAAALSGTCSLTLRGASGAAMLDHLTLDAAQNGHVTIHAWAHDDSGCGAGRHGLTIAGPDGEGKAWLLGCGTQSAEEAYRIFTKAAECIPGMSALSCASANTGFQVTSLISSGLNLRPALVSALGDIASPRFLGAEQLAALRFAAQRHGMRISRSAFQALEQTGLGLLVDDGDKENED